MKRWPTEITLTLLEKPMFKQIMTVFKPILSLKCFQTFIKIFYNFHEEYFLTLSWRGPHDIETNQFAPQINELVSIW